MDIESLTIGQAKELVRLFGEHSIKAISPNLGKVCVVRTYSAGVHIGRVESVSGTAVVLNNARRIWKWGGAFTLSEVSQQGIDAETSRVSISVPEIELTQAIELIPATAAAIKSIDLCHE